MLSKKWLCMEFSSDRLINCLMPSNQINSTMANGTVSIFFTIQNCFHPRGAFWHTAVCTIHSSSVFLCHFCWQQKVSIWYYIHSSAFFLVDTLGAFKQFLQCTCNTKKHNGYFTFRRLTGACSTIISFWWRLLIIIKSSQTSMQIFN